MAPKKSLFERMKLKPNGDWAIEDVKTLCRQCGVEIHKPSSGSHYTVSSDRLENILTVPYNRPIKAVYIRLLVRLIEEHRKAAKGSAGGTR